ncbi:MAG: hypothetical protein RR743_01870, partial [Oscillospiraceae bacterium]
KAAGAVLDYFFQQRASLYGSYIHSISAPNKLQSWSSSTVLLDIWVEYWSKELNKRESTEV